MAEAQARAWWDEVQYLREEIEQRHASERAVEALLAPAGPPAERPVPQDDLAARRAARERARQVPDAPAPRRTVEIRGQTVPAPSVPLVEASRRRTERRPIDLVGPRPDRIALWALLLGITLILVAVSTANAAPF